MVIFSMMLLVDMLVSPLVWQVMLVDGGTILIHMLQ